MITQDDSLFFSVTCCIVSIAHDIENEDEWAAFDPSQKDDFNSWPQMWAFLVSQFFVEIEKNLFDKPRQKSIE